MRIRRLNNVRLSMDEVRKQHDGIKKLYEQGLRGATASVEQVLDLFDTIEALQQEIEKLKATLADWKYNAKCDADHIAALTTEKDELVEEVQKLNKSDASKEQCIIDQHGEIHRLRDELKRYKQAKQEGRLVVLPCKVGSKVYEPETDESARVDSVEIYFHTHMGAYTLDDFGETVFLTREEAEQALREQAID